MTKYLRHEDELERSLTHGSGLPPLFSTLLPRCSVSLAGSLPEPQFPFLRVRATLSQDASCGCCKDRSGFREIQEADRKVGREHCSLCEDKYVFLCKPDFLSGWCFVFPVVSPKAIVKFCFSVLDRSQLCLVVLKADCQMTKSIKNQRKITPSPQQ